MAHSSVLNRTNLASIYFHTTNSDHIRIYYQDDIGNILETEYDSEGKWVAGGGLGVGCLNTGIAAVTWGSGNDMQIRLYFFNKNHRLVERCYGTGTGWTDGGLNALNLSAAPVSALAATATINNPESSIQVYYQGTDGFIWQAYHSSQNHASPGWTSEKVNVPAVPLGSSFAATILGDGRSRRVYTTDTKNQLIELSSADGNSWVYNTLDANSGRQIGAGIACVHWVQPNTDRIAVLSVTVDNQLVLTSYNAGWSGPTVIAETISFSAVACFYYGGDLRIKAYFQPMGKHVTEYGSDGNGSGFAPNQSDVPVHQ